MADDIIKIEAEFDKETKRKNRYQGSVLGVDVSIYIDKALSPVPEKLAIILKD